MIRKGFRMSINPGQHEEYEKRHTDLKVQMPTINENYVPGEGQMLSKSGDWFEIKRAADLVAGKAFHFEIKLKDVEPGMQLVCGLHWYNGKKYGGVVKVFARQKDVENGKWYTFTPVFKEFPAEATSFRVVHFTSPNGSCEDHVKKDNSGEITLSSAPVKELPTKY